MRISKKGFLALRNSVIAAFVLFWNACLFFAFWLNGFDAKLKSPQALKVVGTTTLCTALFALLIVTNRKVRGFTFDPARANLYDPAPYWLVILVCGILSYATFHAAF